jgi:hypothetical protein
MALTGLCGPPPSKPADPPPPPPTSPLYVVCVLLVAKPSILSSSRCGRTYLISPAPAVTECPPEALSCVLCVASNDYGLFKFMVKCADDTMDSCSFGARFQSWALRLGPSRRWVQFRHRGHDAEAFEELSLTDALGKNVHETVAGASVLMRACVFLRSCSESRVSFCSHPHTLRAAGHKMADFFAPQSPIFISHAWSDGTAKFIRRQRSRRCSTCGGHAGYGPADV